MGKNIRNRHLSTRLFAAERVVCFWRKGGARKVAVPCKKEGPVLASTGAAATQLHTQVVINDGSTDGCGSYRIPSLVRTSRGTLIAFSEGRRWPPIDWVGVHLGYKRFTNNGLPWQGKGVCSSKKKTAGRLMGALVAVKKNESQNNAPNQSIDFHKFKLAWVLNGATEPKPMSPHKNLQVIQILKT